MLITWRYTPKADNVMELRICINNKKQVFLKTIWVETNVFVIIIYIFIVPNFLSSFEKISINKGVKKKIEENFAY